MKRTNLVLLPAVSGLSPLTPAVLYEVAAAKYVKIDIADFRLLVKQGVIPARTHAGRTRSIYLKEDLDHYLRHLPVKPASGVTIEDGESPSQPPQGVSIGR
jgi:hypothetical protein